MLPSSRKDVLRHLESLHAFADRHATLAPADGALVRAAFALAIGALGGPGHELMRSLVDRVAEHELPTATLIRLYAARLDALPNSVDAATWVRHVESTLSSMPGAEARVVSWLVARSLFLGVPSSATELPLTASLSELVSSAACGSSPPAVVIAAAFQTPNVYDHERATVVERVLQFATGIGTSDGIRSTLDAALVAAPTIRISVHRLRVVDACLQVAQTINDAESVSRCLSQVIEVSRSSTPPAVADLLGPLRRAVAALNCLANPQDREHFLRSFIEIPGIPEKAPLRAVLSCGFLGIGEVERGKELLSTALNDALHSPTSHRDRFEAGIEVVHALECWDLEWAREVGNVIFANLHLFTDSFTTRKFFSTHQILIAERMIARFASGYPPDEEAA